MECGYRIRWHGIILGVEAEHVCPWRGEIRWNKNIERHNGDKTSKTVRKARDQFLSEVSQKAKQPSRREAAAGRASTVCAYAS